MNHVCLIGRLTKKPTLQFTANKSTPVATLRLAVNDYDGGERTDFFDVVIYGARATSAAEHLTKGRMVAVTGALRLDQWTDNDGQRHSRTYVKANGLDYLPDGRSNGKTASTSADAEPDEADTQTTEPSHPAAEPF